MMTKPESSLDLWCKVTVYEWIHFMSNNLKQSACCDLWYEKVWSSDDDADKIKVVFFPPFQKTFHQAVQDFTSYCYPGLYVAVIWTYVHAAFLLFSPSQVFVPSSCLREPCRSRPFCSLDFVRLDAGVSPLLLSYENRQRKLVSSFFLSIRIRILY